MDSGIRLKARAKAGIDTGYYLMWRCFEWFVPFSRRRDIVPRSTVLEKEWQIAAERKC